jgi:hypothetical protein
MSVKYIRPEVKKLLPIYKMIRDVLAGPKAIKDAKGTYLPIPDPGDDSEHAKKRYLNYVLRAMFFDATSRTHEGYLGQVFYREPQIELPPLLEVLLEDVDGTGLSLMQQSKEAVGENLGFGRAGLYTDYSVQEDRSATRLDQEVGKVRPTITLFMPERIINWRWSMIGNQKILSLVVLEEDYDLADDGFEAEKDCQWRELRLVVPEGGSQPVLRCTIWRDGKDGLYPLDPTFPKMGNGKFWDRIPFEFIGSKNNDPIPDKPPMEGMAHINIGHYRNSAEYEESVFMIGQPTPWGSGITEDWAKTAWNSELRLGCREFIPLPVGGQMGLLQPEPNTMAKEAMEMKRDQMVALGAKLAENATVASTATQENRESVIENSVLSTCAKNVSSAYSRALAHAATYSNIPVDGIVFEINTDFEITRMSAQDRQQLLSEWQGGGITWEEYRWNMKRSGVAFEDDAKAKKQIQAELKENAVDLDKQDPPEEEEVPPEEE